MGNSVTVHPLQRNVSDVHHHNGCGDGVDAGQLLYLPLNVGSIRLHDKRKNKAIRFPGIHPKGDEPADARHKG